MQKFTTKYGSITPALWLPPPHVKQVQVVPNLLDSFVVYAYSTDSVSRRFRVYLAHTIYLQISIRQLKARRRRDHLFHQRLKYSPPPPPASNLLMFASAGHEPRNSSKLRHPSPSASKRFISAPARSAALRREKSDTKLLRVWVLT